MSFWESVLVVLAGVGAGTINTIVGSGSLITFPILLLLGVPPVSANVSNNLGMLPGGIAGAYGYRRELRGRWGPLLKLLPWSVVGAAVGAALLLVLPAEAFRKIVPILIGFGLLMVIFGPRLQRWSAAHHQETGAMPRWQAPALVVGLILAAMYGGYFGAAQGVILMGLLSTLAHGTLQELNGWKNVLASTANFVAAVVFVSAAPEQVDWGVAALIGVGSFIGGFIGAGVGRRLPPAILRAIIIAIGVVGIVKIIFFP
ncbi:sulfite exporter TauE/SafE family protein [Nostocoides australiense]|uniref:Probable membrane transporter protein n=1 Tax=Nostocoides australiense Ben110 TaxID=1193182 RepID=W6K340_9MICO|nr:sulfite exporter TauE/SafE family protein [Tetrasphaera australiensis]MCA0292173.1 sulfite exporter TauE/SafE family protein [Actinomycetota bacterium]MCB1300842.1 sulfite exporter TauE/SafE family protein [Tetrasphaera sp.]CCH75620.1 conserved membrane hypothetical protein [Tetrasphaera australiensis Ben110]HPF80179.1 sulfite exporter TauE/SafE family protein [Tetrasphaera australiensis]HRW01114.1 sulfite exporter TauE/SafE family protein [Tetrasphaera sp.]